MTTPQPASGTPAPTSTARGVHLPSASASFGKKPSKKAPAKKPAKPTPKPAPKRGGGKR